MPIGAPIVERANVLRTYALFAHGRFVSEATGEQPYFEGVSSTATAAGTILIFIWLVVG